MSDLRPSDETGIGLRQYMTVLRRRKLIVVTMLALAVGAASVLTLREQSMYRAETTIVVGQGTGLIQLQNANGIQPFSATMKELVKSVELARGVISDLHLDMTPTSLLSEISVSFNPDSAALDVSVVDHVPVRAQAIASRIGTRFTALVADRLAKGVPNSPASPPVRAVVWDKAHVLPGRVAPTPVKNLIIAAALGLLLGLLAAFVRDHFDRSLRTVDEIEQAFGVPVIGQIPSIGKRSKERPRMLWDENGEFAESFRGLRANLQYLGVDHPLRTILVTSPAADQGKTTVSANLATALAHSGASVIVLEADLRRPRLSSVFDLSPNVPGMTSVLVGNAPLERAVSHIDLPKHPAAGPQERSVSVLASGPLPPNPSEIVGSPRMQRLVEGLANVFDCVVIDSPPLLPVADTLGLARLVDGVIIVVRAKKATRDEAREVKALVERLNLPLVGVVVSDIALRGAYGGYGMYTEQEQTVRATRSEAEVQRLLASVATGGAASRRR
jgi:capsular exopolysaccharide synthesis family protein